MFYFIFLCVEFKFYSLIIQLVTHFQGSNTFTVKSWLCKFSLDLPNRPALNIWILPSMTIGKIAVAVKGYKK